jgi:hypothetical protein
MSRQPRASGSAEEEAATAVRELRRFIALHDETEVEPGSEVAAKLDAARRVVAAYEEVQSWNLSDRGLIQ